MLLLVSVVALGAVAGGVVVFDEGHSTTTDCGLGTGSVHELDRVNATVESASEARRALEVGWADSTRVQAAAHANVSEYEHVDLATGFRDDIRNRGEGEVFGESETVYYFTVDGSRTGYQGYSALGVTESGVIFQARYGSC